MKALVFLIAATFSLGVWGRPNAFGDTIYTNEANFVGALGGSQQFLNDFSDLTVVMQYVHPLQYSSNGLAYAITSIPELHILSQIGFVSTVGTNDTMVVSFTSSNVRAVGGWFYVCDTNAAPANGVAAVRLNDGTTNAIASSPSGPLFYGVISAGPLLTNLTLQSASPGTFPALDHFYVAEGQPVLTAQLPGTNTILLSWPAPATGYALQTATNLSGSDWTPVSTTPETVNGQEQVTLKITGTSAFFRLATQ